ncbi:MAG TPA: hypothetical protein VFC24_16700 [Casimicrobiaceae bacterium]|nr:hypothetical protein [Casimicrobiaceae bacterium]
MSIKRKIIAIAMLLGGSLLAGQACATSPEECEQAAQFIGNAARARDLGMTREDFIAHVRADLEVIRSFPPEMRWFAETEQDEQFLLKGAEDVFDHPLAPETHAMRFARACVSRADV